MSVKHSPKDEKQQPNISTPTTIESIATNTPKSKRLNLEMVPASPTLQEQLQITTAKLTEFIKNSQAETAAKISESCAELLQKSHQSMFEAVKEEIGRVIKENLRLTEQVNSLSTSLDLISAEVNDLKQQKLNNNMEILGLSDSIINAKPPKEVFADLLSSKRIDCDMSKVESVHKRDIKVVSGSKSLLVVSFQSYNEKFKVMAAKWKVDNDNIFFNHSLTYKNRQIFMKARKEAKKLNMRATVAHGKIYVRKAGQSHGTQIKSADDLTQL